MTEKPAEKVEAIRDTELKNPNSQDNIKQSIQDRMKRLYVLSAGQNQQQFNDIVAMVNNHVEKTHGIGTDVLKRVDKAIQSTNELLDQDGNDFASEKTGVKKTLASLQETIRDMLNSSVISGKSDQPESKPVNILPDKINFA